jgi:hypothetical protein
VNPETRDRRADVENADVKVNQDYLDSKADRAATVHQENRVQSGHVEMPANQDSQANQACADVTVAMESPDYAARTVSQVRMARGDEGGRGDRVGLQAVTENVVHPVHLAAADHQARQAHLEHQDLKGLVAGEALLVKKGRRERQDQEDPVVRQAEEVVQDVRDLADRGVRLESPGTQANRVATDTTDRKDRRVHRDRVERTGSPVSGVNRVLPVLVVRAADLARRVGTAAAVRREEMGREVQPDDMVRREVTSCARQSAQALRSSPRTSVTAATIATTTELATMDRRTARGNMKNKTCNDAVDCIDAVVEPADRHYHINFILCNI